MLSCDAPRHTEYFFPASCVDQVGDLNVDGTIVRTATKETVGFSRDDDVIGVCGFGCGGSPSAWLALSSALVFPIHRFVRF